MIHWKKKITNNSLEMTRTPPCIHNQTREFINNIRDSVVGLDSLVHSSHHIHHEGKNLEKTWWCSHHQGIAIPSVIILGESRLPAEFVTGESRLLAVFITEESFWTQGSHLSIFKNMQLSIKGQFFSQSTVGYLNFHNWFKSTSRDDTPGSQLQIWIAPRIID